MQALKRVMNLNTEQVHLGQVLKKIQGLQFRAFVLQSIWSGYKTSFYWDDCVCFTHTTNSGQTDQRNWWRRFERFHKHCQMANESKKSKRGIDFNSGYYCWGYSFISISIRQSYCNSKEYVKACNYCFAGKCRFGKARLTFTFVQITKLFSRNIFWEMD